MRGLQLVIVHARAPVYCALKASLSIMANVLFLQFHSHSPIHVNKFSAVLPKCLLEQYAWVLRYPWMSLIPRSYISGLGRALSSDKYLYGTCHWTPCSSLPLPT